jgi:hypothetical protein
MERDSGDVGYRGDRQRHRDDREKLVGIERLRRNGQQEHDCSE